MSTIQEPKLSVDEQIENMEKSGITFFKVSSKDEVVSYLTTQIYYSKLKSYANNFEENKKKSKYINLDFAYLQDLARLDVYFKELIFDLTSDVEHLLKVRILSESQKNSKDNGYTVVKDFLEKYKRVKDSIEKQDGYNKSLIEKYNDNLPLWVFLEVISLGDLILFYDFYNNRFPHGNNVHSYLWSVRMLRNAAAHNSCMLNRLREFFDDKTKLNKKLVDLLRKEYSGVLSMDRIMNNLKTPVVQDFVDVLIVYKKLDKNKKMLLNRIPAVETFLNRCKENAEYYKSNNKLIAKYSFVCDFFEAYKKNILTKTRK